MPGICVAERMLCVSAVGGLIGNALTFVVLHRQVSYIVRIDHKDSHSMFICTILGFPYA
jgi:hypothetical protein